MDDSAIRRFFTHPTQTYHRRYEALRAVMVDGRSQKDVAKAYGYEYGSFRLLVHEFRQSVGTEGSMGSPFFRPSRPAARR
jgi:Xaa-Pro aminopeptidase